MKTNVLIMILLSLVTHNVCKAAAYYMSPTGNDSNPGTLSAPWKTLTKLTSVSVKSLLRPGDYVYFRGGNYIVTSADKHTYSFGPSGTATAPITYKNYNNEIPVLVYDWRIVPPTKTYFLFLSGSYTTFEGLTFRQSEESRSLGMIGNREINYDRVKSALYANATNIIIRKCTIDNFSGVGVQAGGSTNLIIEFSTIKNTGSHAFYISGKNGIYRYNLTDGSRAKNIQQGIQLQYASSIGNKVYGNLVKNGQGTGIVLSGGVSNNQIFNNVIINGGVGNLAGNAIGFRCENNVPLGTGNKVYNNTIMGKSPRLVSNVVCAGANQSDKVDIYENIFYPSTAVAIGYTGSKLKNNIFYNILGTAPAGNILANPLLANPLGTTGVSAKLKTGSPAINAGKASVHPTIASPTTDFSGAHRPSAYDIGAYEYGATGSTIIPLAPTGLSIK